MVIRLPELCACSGCPECSPKPCRRVGYYRSDLCGVCFMRLVRQAASEKIERMSDCDLNSALAAARSGDFEAVEIRLSRVSERIELPEEKKRGVAVRPPGTKYTKKGSGKLSRAMNPWFD